MEPVIEITSLRYGDNITPHQTSHMLPHVRSVGSLTHAFTRLSSHIIMLYIHLTNAAIHISHNIISRLCPPFLSPFVSLTLLFRPLACCFYSPVWFTHAKLRYKANYCTTYTCRVTSKDPASGK